MADVDMAQALDFILGWDGGWLELDFYREGWHGKRWCRAGAGWLQQEVETANRWQEELRCYLPRPRPWWGTASPLTVLWCRVSGKEQAKRLSWMKPLPSMVLRAGATTERVAFWSLRERVSYSEALAANRRIAYRVGAKQKDGDPDDFSFVVPGTMERRDRKVPRPWVCTRLVAQDFTVDQVVGRLKDPPDVKWTERRAAA